MPAQTKIDLYKLYKSEYVSPKTPALIEVKPAQYLAISGRGKAGGKIFQEKLGALYNVAFTIKMAKKFAGRDYAVAKLEGLWGREDLESWTLLIRTPDFIQNRDLSQAIEALKAKGKPADVGEVRLQELKEGRCVQVLHVGSYDREQPSIEAMHKFASARGLNPHGLHHEIHLSDPRRVAPEKLRAILRQPVR
jgi:hypothetical protein